MSGPIVSVHNPRLRAALRLRDRGARDASGLTLIDGARETLRALEAGAHVETVYLCRELVHGHEGARLLARLDEPGRLIPEIVPIGPAAHERLAYGARGDGVVAVAKVPEHALEGLRLPPDALVAVLDGLEKPGNLGAILRSADGAGLDGVVVADARTDLWNPNVVRASVGSVFHVPLAAADGGAVRDWLRVRGLRLVAARVDGAVAWDTIDYRGATAIVLGSEAEGLGPAWAAPDVTAVRLPMLGVADSLGVAAAAAVLFYEARRQRLRGA